MTTMLLQKEAPANTVVEISSSDCNDMRRTMKAVTFFPHVLVKPTTHLNDYTPQEHAQTFYSEADYKTMRKECMSTLKYFSDDGQLLSKKMRKAKKTKRNTSVGGATDRDGDDALCFRGLEYRTPQGQQRRSHFKYQGLDTVLDLQEPCMPNTRPWTKKPWLRHTPTASRLVGPRPTATAWKTPKRPSISTTKKILLRCYHPSLNPLPRPPSKWSKKKNTKKKSIYKSKSHKTAFHHRPARKHLLPPCRCRFVNGTLPLLSPRSCFARSKPRITNNEC